MIQPVQVGDYVPLLVKVVEDRDPGNVVLEIVSGRAYVSMSQADIEAARVDRLADN